MMQPDLRRVTIYVRPGPTDMRKQANGLAVIAEQQMAKNPLSGAVFLFCNRQRRILKALYWDQTGFALWQKRLEKHRFPWPESEEAARVINRSELKMLLSGIDFWAAHRPLRCESVS
jgi:transposase